MAVSARKHTVPAAGETPRRVVFNELAASINDIVPVPNLTARAQLVTDVVAAGHTWPRPLYVDRADAHPARRLEVTTDGASWVPVGARYESTVFLTTANAVANGGTIPWSGINSEHVGGPLPYATRLHINISAVAGFDSAAMDVGLEVDRSSESFAPITQMFTQPVRAPAAGWAGFSHMAIIDLPANRGWDGFCRARTSGAAAHYRLGINVTRGPA